MSASDTGGRLTASVSASRREGPTDPGFDLIRAKDPFTLVIFGASGDLARRKLIPALFHLKASGYLPERYAVIGFSRTPIHTLGGNQTNAGHDVSSTANSSTSSNVHTDTTSHVETSVHEDNSVHQDSSIHSDNSFSQENSLHQTNETHFEPDTHIGF